MILKEYFGLPSLLPQQRCLKVVRMIFWMDIKKWENLELTRSCHRLSSHPFLVCTAKEQNALLNIM